MNLAEKLTTIAENEQLVANANTELEEALYSKSEGGKDWYNRFWDSFQQNGTRRSYWGAFSGSGWNDEIFNPKYPLSNVGEVAYMFYRTEITTTPTITVNTYSMANMFARATAMRWVEGIVILREITSTNNLFLEASSLVHCPITTIDNGAISASVDASVCPFDKETITSWVNALSNTKTGQTLTLNLAAVNKAFETSKGANDGSTSAEWNTLQNTKSNWTISLVES